MIKECTILTFDEMEELRNKFDYIVECLIKVSNDDCDGVSIQCMCESLVSELKEIREQLA